MIASVELSITGYGFIDITKRIFLELELTMMKAAHKMKAAAQVGKRFYRRVCMDQEGI